MPSFPSAAETAHENLRNSEVLSECSVLSLFLVTERSQPGTGGANDRVCRMAEDLSDLLRKSGSGLVMERADGVYSMRSAPPYVFLKLVRQAFFRAAGLDAEEGIPRPDSSGRLATFADRTDRLSKIVAERVLRSRTVERLSSSVAESVDSAVRALEHVRAGAVPSESADLAREFGDSARRILEGIPVSNAEDFEWLASDDALELQKFLDRAAYFLLSEGVNADEAAKNRLLLEALEALSRQPGLPAQILGPGYDRSR